MLSRQRESLALDLLEEVLTKPRETRRRWLENQCGNDLALLERVGDLLASSDHEPNTWVTGGALDFPQQVQPFVPTVEGFRLIRKVGSGGMGEVFMAERVDAEFNQTVAIKFLRMIADDNLRQQFNTERQILASLKHGNIVTLLDGGTTSEGLPYIVTEFVDGVGIRDYLDSVPDASLTERLRLFDIICQAVEHAHSALVIHRDIKPSNILVQPDGTPKLLDFGIAKLQSNDGSRTLVQGLTPAYASPEQIQGLPLSTATDIYSLGAVLYLLVTRTSAFGESETSSISIQQSVLNGDIERPISRATKTDEKTRVPRDLNAVILKAMSLTPENRYPSVSSLRLDISNVLLQRPVLAREDTLLYRAGRFYARQRAGVLAATLATVALLSALGVSLYQTSVAAEQLARSESVRDFLGDVLMSPATRFDLDISAGADARMSDVLEVAGTHIASHFEEYPDLQVDLLSRISVALERLSKNDLAVSLSDQAVQIANQIESPQLRIDALIAHGKNLTRPGRSEGGLAVLLQAKTELELIGENRSMRYLYLLNDIGNAYGTFDRFEDQEQILKLGINILNDVLPDKDSPVFAGAYNNLSSALMQQGKLGEARAANQHALGIVSLKLDSQDVLRAYSHMYASAIELLSGQFARSIDYAEVALEVFPRGLGDGTKELGTLWARMALAADYLGMEAEAQTWLTKARSEGDRVSYHSMSERVAAVTIGNSNGLYEQALTIDVQGLLNTKEFLPALLLFEAGIARVKTKEPDAWATLQAGMEAMRHRFPNYSPILESRLQRLGLDQIQITDTSVSKRVIVGG